MGTYHEQLSISARNAGALLAFSILQMHMVFALSEMVRSGSITEEQKNKFEDVLDAQIAAVEEKHFS